MELLGFSQTIAMEEQMSRILEYLGVEVNEDVSAIIDILQNNETVSENDIADKLGVKINHARKILYKLHALGFVEYSKKKDEEKKWWYIYFWSLNKSKLNEVYNRRKKQELARKENLLKEEHKFSFECKKEGKKFEYKDALSNNFSCLSCSRPLSEIKNAKWIKQLENSISNLKKELCCNDTLTTSTMY